MTAFINYIQSPEFTKALPVLIAIIAEIIVGLWLNIKNKKETKITRRKIEDLNEKVEDRKLQRQIRIVLKENAELKKSLNECMEQITKIKRRED